MSYSFYRNGRVLDFILRSKIHFETTAKNESMCLFCSMTLFDVFNIIKEKGRLSVLHGFSLGTSSKFIWLYCVNLLLKILFCFIDPNVYLFTNATLPWLFTFEVNLEIKLCEFYCVLFQNYFDYLSSFAIFVNCRIVNFWKKMLIQF